MSSSLWGYGMFFNRKLRDTLFASVSVGTLAAASSALGNPLDPTVIAGDVTISGTGSDHVIIQNDSMRTISFCSSPIEPETSIM